MEEFVPFLNDIAKNIHVSRMIPWRITRKQSWASNMYISFAYQTHSWLKYNMKKWSTSQELFVICDVNYYLDVCDYISGLITIYTDK